MKTSLWGIAVAVALLGMLAYSWAEGQWTGRWHPSQVSQEAALRLKSVPMTVGDWQGEDAAFNESQLALAELDGYLHRIYTHRRTGAQVQVLIVCGRAGPVSLHTPDVCYRGLGFSTLSPPVRAALTSADGGDPGGECWMADFQKTTPLGREFLRIGWTWLAEGRWQAADQPRFEFAREPVLFKAYFIHPQLKAGDNWDEDPIPSFARDWLPIVTPHLQNPEAASAPQASSLESPDGI